MLQLTDASMKLFEALDTWITLINNNSGFEIFIWYKRGCINDESIIDSKRLNTGASRNTNTNYNNNEEDFQVDLCNVSYYIVHITPINRDFLDLSN